MWYLRSHFPAGHLSQWFYLPNISPLIPNMDVSHEDKMSQHENCLAQRMFSSWYALLSPLVSHICDPEFFHCCQNLEQKAQLGSVHTRVMTFELWLLLPFPSCYLWCQQSGGRKMLRDEDTMTEMGSLWSWSPSLDSDTEAFPVIRDHWCGHFSWVHNMSLIS